MEETAIVKTQARRRSLTCTWRKKLLIMRLTAIFLLAALHVSAGSNAQHVSISGNNLSLSQIIETIRLQTGYYFVYNKDELKKARHVAIHVQDAPLEEVLKKVLQPQGYRYEIKYKTIIIIPTSVPAEPPVASPPVIPPSVSGRVVSANGTPLEGASVKIKGANVGVTTDGYGNFTLEAAPGQTLVVSYIGYKSKEVTVEKEGRILIILDASESPLDVVQVIGYGTTTRRYATGSIVKVTSEEIAKQPVTNALQALQGRMAGVTVTQANGLPGSGITVQVRGANSLEKGNLPLYIIDGVPYLSEPISAQTNSSYTTPSAEGATSPMNSINPADIESIEVLKDADATAIYGSRGANGVILITTKKGKAGKTQFSMNVSTGISKVPHFVKTLSTEEYLALRKTGFANNGITPTAANAQDLVLWLQDKYTDFQKMLIGNTAHATDVTASLSGGDTRTNFLISGSYHKETNVFYGGQGYHRAAANFSINHSTLDKRLNIGFAAIYSADRNNISVTDLTSAAYSLPPNFPLYNDDGSLYWTGVIGGHRNPLGYLKLANKNVTSNLLSSLNIQYRLLKGLDVKTTVGFSRTDMDQVRLNPMSAQDPGIASNVASSVFNYNVTNNYIVEPQITYKKQIWKGTLEALAGGTWQFKQSKQPIFLTASNFASDEFISNPSAAATLSARTSSQDYKYASLFGRLNYNLDGKYLLNLVFRRDGSSRFGPGNRFGNFGSVGAGWIFSEEAFIARSLPWLSFGKLRGSYGIAGSDAIGNYMYLDSYSTFTYAYNGVTGLYPSRLANSAYKWEETRKIEAALELGFLEDRLLVSGAWYRNRTGNQLINYTVSGQTGFTSYQSNLPALVENRGWEVTVNTSNIRKKDLNWSTQFNISANRNKLLRFDNIEKSSYYTRYIVGNPISSSYGYKFDGVNDKGLPQMKDLNGDGAITSGFVATGRGDRYFLGSRYPEFFGGMNNSLSWKGFTLDVMLQFVKQKGESILRASFYPPGYMYNNSSSATYDYLALSSPEQLATATTSTPAGREAYIAYSNYTGSDAGIVDASFIRLKNVSLSYTLPKKLTGKAKIGNARIYLQGQNLGTITSYDGYDPESQGTATPPLRTIVSGIQVTF